MAGGLQNNKGGGGGEEVDMKKPYSAMIVECFCRTGTRLARAITKQGKEKKEKRLKISLTDTVTITAAVEQVIGRVDQKASSSRKVWHRKAVAITERRKKEMHTHTVQRISASKAKQSKNDLLRSDKNDTLARLKSLNIDSVVGDSSNRHRVINIKSRQEKES